jgi:hypothetical protein
MVHGWWQHIHIHKSITWSNTLFIFIMTTYRSELSEGKPWWRSFCRDVLYRSRSLIIIVRIWSLFVNVLITFGQGFVLFSSPRRYSRERFALSTLSIATARFPSNHRLKTLTKKLYIHKFPIRQNIVLGKCTEFHKKHAWKWLKQQVGNRVDFRRRCIKIARARELFPANFAFRCLGYNF